MPFVGPRYKILKAQETKVGRFGQGFMGTKKIIISLQQKLQEEGGYPRPPPPSV